MATRYKTEFISNQIYFITFTISDWQLVFTNDKYINLVYKWFDYVKENYGNKIHSYVIMPNHIHVLMHISDLSPVISKLIQNAKRFMAYEIIKFLKEDNSVDILEVLASKAKHSKGANYRVFEERYDSKIIESEKLFLEKLNYIHNNPGAKKWQLADLPEEYIYSSASNYILGTGIYRIDFLE